MEEEKRYTEEEKRKLYNSQTQLPPEFAEILNDHFWELLDNEKDRE